MDPRLKLRIWIDYFEGEMNRAEIATKHQISQSSLDQLMTREHWPARRRAFEKELFDDWHYNIQRLQQRHVVQVVARQIANAQAFAAKIMEMLSSAVVNCKDMLSLAQALKAISDVAARAVGLDRMGVLDRQEQPKKLSMAVQYDLIVSDPDDPSVQLSFETPAELPASTGNDQPCLQEHPAQLSPRPLSTS
ncbi:MAG: hypothetical protein NTV49_11790 [Kiritimatiellaeota bacterium]|nr:hypothetical protein [Kiritimatiellota bacterium]